MLAAGDNPLSGTAAESSVAVDSWDSLTCWEYRADAVSVFAAVAMLNAAMVPMVSTNTNTNASRFFKIRCSIESDSPFCNRRANIWQDGFWPPAASVEKMTLR